MTLSKLVIRLNSCYILSINDKHFNKHVFNPIIFRYVFYFTHKNLSHVVIDFPIGEIQPLPSCFVRTLNIQSVAL